MFKDSSYLELWWLICSAERNHLCSFEPGHYKEHFCDIIFNLDQWFKDMLFKDISYLALAPLFDRVEPYVQSLVEGIMRNNSVKLF